MHRIVGIGRVTVHEGLKGHEFGQLTAENLRVASQMVHHTLRRLLILREVTALEEAVCVRRRVHEEVWRPVQFNNDATEFVWVAVIVLEVDGFDGRKGVLDFVARLLIVDIVGHSAFVRRVKNDEIHRILSHTRPLANTEGAAGQVVNYCGIQLGQVAITVYGFKVDLQTLP